MQYQNLRIYNQDQSDFISLHGGEWKTPISDIKNEVKKVNQFWINFRDAIEVDLINAEYDFQNIISWHKKLEDFISVISYFPDYHDFSSLMCCKSLTRFHTFPLSLDPHNSLTNSLGFSSPDIIATSKGKGFSFSGIIPKKKILEKSIDTREFSIVRIITQTSSDQVFYVDVKVRNFSRGYFLKLVLSMPEFWRNFHFVTRNKMSIKNTVHPAYEINKVLAQFYSSSNILTPNDLRHKTKKEIFDHVKTNNFMKIFVNTFATHLMFMEPGLILPLSQGEQLWSNNQKPSMQISISENEVNLITIPFSDNAFSNREMLQSFSDNYSNRELAFASHFDLPKYNGGKYLITNSEEFAYIYEANIVELFDSLTKLDAQRF